jgi:membrane protease YdiL (CAAX protease family)
MPAIAAGAAHDQDGTMTEPQATREHTPPFDEDRNARPSLGRRIRKAVAAHGLLAFVLLAYGVTWTSIAVGFVGMNAGVLSEEGSLVSLLAQLAAAGPLIAALVVRGVTEGRRGVLALGRATLQWRASPLWYAFIFVGIPTLMLTGMSLAHGAAFSEPLRASWPMFLTRFPVLVLAVALFTGLAEEPGWRGYALASANRRFRPWTAALIVSVVWALWHLPNALFSVGGLAMMAAHVPATVVNGLVQAWVFNATRGSVFIAMLVHGSMNATAGMILEVAAQAGSAVSPTEYYALSAVTFGALMVLVAIATRLQIGVRGGQPVRLPEP